MNKTEFKEENCNNPFRLLIGIICLIFGSYFIYLVISHDCDININNCDLSSQSYIILIICTIFIASGIISIFTVEQRRKCSIIKKELKSNISPWKILSIILCIGLVASFFIGTNFKNQRDFLQKENKEITGLYIESLKDNIYNYQDKCNFPELFNHGTNFGWDIALSEDCIKLKYYYVRLGELGFNFTGIKEDYKVYNETLWINNGTDWSAYDYDGYFWYKNGGLAPTDYENEYVSNDFIWVRNESGSLNGYVYFNKIFYRNGEKI
jgi:hypothetical protein